MTLNNLCSNIVSTMIQKIIRVGNSMAVTIPKSAAQEKNVKVGDTIDFDFTPTKTSKSKITPDFIAWVDKYIENNRPALEELANK